MKNKKLVVIISIITIISFIIGVSYAYFTTIVIGNDTASSNVVISGTLKLTYNGTDYIDMNNKQPGDFDTMTFTVENTGTLPVSGYDIYFSNVINTFYTKSELVYEIDCTSSDAVTCLDKSETEVPSVSGVAINQTDIAPGTTHTYTLTVTFTDTGLNQNYNQGKTILFDVTINEQYDIPVLIAATYVGNPTWDTVGYFWDYKASIASLTFEKGIDVPVGAVASWDVSAAQDGSIMAYIIGSTTYDLYIQTESDFLLSNPNSSYLFYDFAILSSINNISMLKTHYVTNMAEMFRWCNGGFGSLDLSSFDTSSVTDMNYMFCGSINITSLNLSTWNTSNVTNMYGMFYYCSDLLSLDLSSFSTESLTGSIYGIFGGLEDMVSINLGNMTFENVTNWSWMFKDCYSLLTLDISKLNTRNATNMSGTFYGLHSLTSLNVSTLDTSNVTNMIYLFSELNSITSLDLSTLDTSSCTNMGDMFYGSLALVNLDLSTFDTSKVTNMSWMFDSCTALTNLNLSSFDTSLVTTTQGMFENCTSLANIDFRLANFTSVTTYTSMFTGITSGITITVLDSTAQTWITARLTDSGKTGNVIIYV